MISEGKKREATVDNKELAEHYYVESDQGLLKLLTENCLPILKDMMGQIDRFNSHNNMTENNEFSDFEAELLNLLRSKHDFSIESETTKGLVKFREVEKEVERIQQRKSLVP